MQKLALFLSILVLVSCKNSEVLFGQGAVSKKNEQPVSLPVEIYRNLIFVPVEIDGKTYRFLFDSGAPMVVSKELRESLAMKIEKRSPVRDSQGKVAYQNYVRMPRFSIGGEEFRNFVAIEADLRFSPLLNCLNFDGIIGANLMQFKYWEMNVRDSLLLMSNTKDHWSLEGERSYRIPFQTKTTRTPVIQLPINGFRVKNITFDTGSTGVLSLAKDEAGPLLKGQQAYFRRQGFLSGGLYGSKADTAEEYQVNFDFPDTNFTFPLEVAYGKDSRLLGMSFLSQFRVFIDYPAQEILLQPIASYTANPLWPVSPYFNGKIIVGQTNTLLERSRIDIALGDTIIACNGVDYNDATKDDYCQIIEQFSTGADSLNLTIKGKGDFMIFRESVY